MAPGKNFDAAPAPPKLNSKPIFLNRTNVNKGFVLLSSDLNFRCKYEIKML
jgi:hypothetical protein